MIPGTLFRRRGAFVIHKVLSNPGAVFSAANGRAEERIRNKYYKYQRIKSPRRALSACDTTTTTTTRTKNGLHKAYHLLTACSLHAVHCFSPREKKENNTATRERVHTLLCTDTYALTYTYRFVWCMVHRCLLFSCTARLQKC